MEVIGVEGAKELGLEVSEESRLLCTMKAEPEGRGMTSPCPEDSEGGVMWLALHCSSLCRRLADTPCPLTVLTLFAVPFIMWG